MEKFRELKIIFFIENNFDSRDFQRYGIQTFVDSGFAVELWNLTPYLKPKYFNVDISKTNKQNISQRIIRNRAEAEQSLLNLKKNNVVVASISINKNSSFLFKYLSKNNIVFGFLAVNVIPVSRIPFPIIPRLIRIIKNPKILIPKLCERLGNSLSRIPKANFCIVGGEFSKIHVKRQAYFGNATKMIEAHTLDYDNYLRQEKSNDVNFLSKNYAVMLDEYGPYHPDSLNSGNEPDCYAESYYPQLNKFFKTLEDNLNLEVIIAAHPRSNYDEIGNPFKGRKIIKGKTIELVKYAKLVLIHASTAINYAVLYLRPVVFLTSPNYSKYYQHSIKIAAESLIKAPLDLSKEIVLNGKDIYQVDGDVYNSYKVLYIKDQNSNKRKLWEIFIDYLIPSLLEAKKID